MEHTPFMDLVAEASNHLPLRRIARETGLEHTRIRRMAIGDTPWKIEVVVALARRYRIPFGVALASAGFITEDEARAMEPSLSLRTVPHRDLLAELMRRIETGEVEDGPVGRSMPARKPRTRKPAAADPTAGDEPARQRAVRPPLTAVAD